MGRRSKSIFFSSSWTPGEPARFSKNDGVVVSNQPRLWTFLKPVVLHPLRCLEIWKKQGARALYAHVTKSSAPAEAELAELIQNLKPDLIHSMHTQSSGYLVSSVRRTWRGPFPCWIHSTWGSDLYFWGRFPEHAEKIRELMGHLDFFIGEGKREDALAKSFGFSGEILPSISAYGGFDLKKLPSKAARPPSTRKIILIKGYQNIVGRFLVALRAIELCADLLTSYEIHVISANDESKILARLFEIEHGITVRIHDHLSHAQILELQAESRLSLALSLSDGVPAFFIEAMATGSFPIQTHTSIANEWIVDGIGGILVPPNDPDVAAKAIRRALTDDALVDSAARTNIKQIAERMDESQLRERMRQMYQRAQSKCR